LDETTSAKAQEHFEAQLQALNLRTDRSFAALTLLEWVGVTLFALAVVPWAWPGHDSSAIRAVIPFCALIAGLSVALVFGRPGSSLTRHMIAASQMLLAGLMVHLTAGRIETHFMYFGLLAALAFYRDWTVLLTATLVAGLDHSLRGAFFPQSMYGVHHVSAWRTVEHVAWVLFEVAVLSEFIRQARQAMYAVSRRNALLEWVNDQTSQQVQLHTADLRAEIAERERAEEALKDSELRYRVMFEKSPLPMWLFDPSTLRFLAVNDQAVLKYGYTHEEFLRMTLPDIRPSEDIAALGQALRADTGGYTTSRERRHLRKDGTMIDVEVTSHKVEWNGKPARLVLANDITERKKAERERESMEVQLRHAQKLESIGQLAAGIAHEINTPTQYIGDNVRFLGDSFRELGTLIEKYEHLVQTAEAERLCPDQISTIREIYDQVDAGYLLGEIPRAVDQTLEGIERVSTIVKAMKEFSHPGKKEKSPANLNDAIRSTVTVSRSEWKYVADVELDLDPRLPLVDCLLGDFNQVILNLIVNAAHAIQDAKREGDKGFIRIQTKSLPGWAEISVADTGTGIPEAVQSKMFDPFFTTKQVGKGTGQGLAIARSVIVDRHDGTIEFETKAGEGTVFTVRLPVSSDAPAAEANEIEYAGVQ
jgi:PAS domain S-box-containing protein